MSTDHDQAVVRRRTQCSVCGSCQLELAIDLPRLPLTGLYSPQPSIMPSANFDQSLLICSACGHAQAGYQIQPSLLYNREYSFRTSLSATARRGTDFFVGALDEVAGSRQFKCVLDLGCNDLHLLRRLESRAEIRIGIDPIWKGQEDEQDNHGIHVIGATIEAVDFREVLDTAPDLIVCRHTLEHIAEPRAVLQQLLQSAADDALFVFEVPGFDTLVRKHRFDQVFHQHLQYFSLSTFQRLILEAGAEYLDFHENYHDWGALLVAFRKPGKQPRTRDMAPPSFTPSEIHSRYRLFRQHLAIFNQVLHSVDRGAPLYGYGAAQMLPVLAYHMENDLTSLTAILDDDASRDGWYFQNLVPPIRYSGAVSDLEVATVFVTAVDNVQPILTKLLAQRPKHILFPFNLF